MSAMCTKRKALLAAAIAGMGFTGLLRADTLTWTFTPTATWSSPGTWAGNTWVNGSDALIIPAATGSITLVQAQSANSLTVASTGSTTWTLNGSSTGIGTVSLGGGGLSVGTVSVATTTFNMNVPLTLTANQTWINRTGASVNLNSLVNFNGSTITIASTAGGAINLSNNGSLGFNTGTGTIIINGNGASAVLAAGSNTALGNTALVLKGAGRIDTTDAASTRVLANDLYIDVNNGVNNTTVPNIGGQSNVGALVFTGNLTVLSPSRVQMDCGNTANSIIQNQTVTFTGATTLNADLALNVVDQTAKPSGTNITTFAGPVGGTGGLIKVTDSGGWLVLAANNTYAGATTVQNGTLVIGNGGTSGSFGVGSVTIDASAHSGTNVSFNRSDTYTVSNAISGSGSIYQIGSGTTVLGGASIGYTGTTGVNRGTLKIDFTQAGSPSDNVVNSSSPLSLGGGKLLVNASGANTQTFASTSVISGASSVAANFADPADALNLTGITRQTGGVVDFTLPVNGSITTTTANTASTILGGWATVGATTWAVNDGTGKIVGLADANYGHDFITNGVDVDSPAGGGSTTGPLTINSLRFNDGSADSTVDLTNGNMTVSGGGILMTSGAGSHTVTFNNGNLTTGNGQDLVVLQNASSGTMIINSVVGGPGTGLTKAGAGTLVLTNTNTFDQGLRLNGGSTVFSAAGNLGNGSIILNGGALSYSDTVNLTLATPNSINVGPAGGTIDLQHSFISGGGAKFNLNTASFITGGTTAGTINMTGKGIISVGNVGNTYNGAGWNLLGGVLEVANANGVGQNRVPIAIQPSGELSVKGVTMPNPVFLNGGVLGSDSGNGGTISSAVTVQTDSQIRLGRFYGPGNNNFSIAGSVLGSGNLSLINSVDGPHSDATNPGQSAPSLQVFTLSGDNTRYTGTLTVDGGHQVSFFSRMAIMPNLAATSSDTAIPVINFVFDVMRLPQPTITCGANTVGVFSTTGNGSGYTAPGGETLDLSTLANGKWFFGCAQTGNVSWFGNIIPSTDDTGNRVYRLGGGGGGNTNGRLFIGSANTLKDFNTGTGTVATNVLIGDARLGGLGTVRYGAAQNYTGSTTIANGTLELGFANDTVPHGTQMNFGATGGGVGTLDLAGKNQTVGGLNVVAGAVAANQLVVNNGAADSVLTLTNSAALSDYGGLIKNGATNNISLVVAGTVAGNTQILSGANTYTGTTAVNGGTLRVNGVHTGGGNYTIGSAATIGGNGNIGSNVNVQSGGHVSPGPSAASVGTLTVSNLSLDTAQLDFEVGNGGVDQVITNGLTLANVSTFNLSDIGGAAPADGSYVLIDYTGSALADLSNFTPATFDFGRFHGVLVNDTVNTSIDLQLTAVVTSATWTGNVDNTWVTPGNWTGSVPNAVDATANFATISTGQYNVAVGAGGKTVGTVNFDSSTSYTLGTGGNNAITMDVSTGNATINDVNGSHTISAPLALNDNTNVTVTNAADTLSVANLQDTSNSITKAGAGKLSVNRLRAAGITVNAGTVTIAANGSSASASKLATLAIAGGPSAPTASFDLNDNDMIVTTTPKADVVSMIKTARNGNHWDLQGITSTAARNVATHITGLGVITGAEFTSANTSTNTVFDGMSFSPTDTLVKYTYNGDTDFNGVVNFDDYSRIDNGFNHQNDSGFVKDWFSGDFDFNNVINFDDYALIDAAFNGQSGTLREALGFLNGDPGIDTSLPGVGEVAAHLQEFGPGYAAAFIAAVPEPTTLALIGVPALAGMIRRRRRHA